MTLHRLDFGTAGNNDGEPLRTAFPKLDANDAYLDGRITALETVGTPDLAAHVAAADPHTQYLLESALEYVLPETFGAQGGNPLFDSLAALNAARDEAVSSGKTLRLGPNTYYTSDTWSLDQRIHVVGVPNFSGICLDNAGSGKDTIRLGFNVTQTSGITLRDFVVLRTQVDATGALISMQDVGVTQLNNLRLYANGKAGFGVKVLRGIISQIYDCHIDGFTNTGVVLAGSGLGASRTVDFELRRTRVEGGTYGLSFGDYVEGTFTDEVIFFDQSGSCVRVNPASDGVALGSHKFRASDFDTAVHGIFATHLKNFTVDGCWFSNLSSGGLTLNKADGGAVSANQFYVTGGNNVTIGDGTNAVTNIAFSGNQMVGAGAARGYLIRANADNISIDGDVVRGMTFAGIDGNSEASTNVSIDGVQFRSNAANLIGAPATGWSVGDNSPPEIGALTLSNGANANVALAGNAKYFRISGPSGAFSISGLTGGAEQRMVRLYNTTAQTLTLTNDATSTAANRIVTLTGGDVVVPGPGSVDLVYDSTTSRWLVVAISSLISTSMVADDAITYAKIQDVSATSRLLGRVTSGAGVVEELTAANAKSILGYPTSSTDNTVPRFNSTAGNLQTSGVSIDDSNGLSAAQLTSSGGEVRGSGQSGQIQVGATGAASTSGILLVRGSSAGFNAHGFELYTGNAEAMRVDSNQEPYFPNLATTASAANAFLDSGSSPANHLMRSTSSLRYKRDIEDLDIAFSKKLLKARPIYYRSKVATDNQDYSHWGLLAEELAEIDPRLVHWAYPAEAWEEYDDVEPYTVATLVRDEDGKALLDDTGSPVYQEHVRERTVTRRRLKEGAVKVPDGVQYERLTVHLLALVRDLYGKIDN